MLKRAVAVLASLAIGASSLPAQVLYDNGLPDMIQGNEMTQWIQADNFTLLNPSLVSAVRFWSVEQPFSYQGSIAWWIYSDASGQPGSTLFSGTATPTRTADGSASWGDVYQYDFATSFFLAAGQYWLALHNGPATTSDRYEFYWATSAEGGSSYAMEDMAPFDGSWYQNGQEHAFALYNATTVPEPGTMLLLGTGLLGPVLAARRRRSRG